MSIDEEKVQTLHRDADVFLSFVSCHCDYLPDGRLDNGQFFRDDPRAQGSFPKFKRGGVDAFIMAFGVGGSGLFPGKASVGRLFQTISNFHHVAAAHAEELCIANSPDEFHRAREQEKIPVMFHTAGAHIDGDLSVLAGYKALGVSTIHAPFDMNKPKAGDVEQDGGRLTDFGKGVLREMERLDIVPDVSHSTDEAFWEILDLTEKPIIASHSNCRSLCDVSRNLTDEQITAIGERNGVIGVHFGAGFIENEFMDRFRATGFYEKLREWEAELRQKYPDPFVYLSKRLFMDDWENNELHRLERSVPRPPLSKLVDHIEHIIELAGIDAVGVGTDYDLGAMPDEVEDAGNLSCLTRALLERGYSDDEIKKFGGGNFMRIFT